MHACCPLSRFRRCWSFSSAPDVPTEILQEVDQNVILYEECNEMLKKATSSSVDLVKRGMVCGYKERGKDACQVRSQTPFLAPDVKA